MIGYRTDPRELPAKRVVQDILRTEQRAKWPTTEDDAHDEPPLSLEILRRDGERRKEHDAHA